jgi:hypothetical protein
MTKQSLSDNYRREEFEIQKSEASVLRALVESTNVFM